MPKKNDHWIQSALAGHKKGSLHKALGVAKGKDIPVAKLKKAAKGDGKTAKMARLAQTLRKLH